MKYNREVEELMHFRVTEKQENSFAYFNIESSHLKSRKTFFDSVYEPSGWGTNRHLWTSYVISDDKAMQILSSEFAR